MSALTKVHMFTRRTITGSAALAAGRAFSVKPRLCEPKIVEVVSYDQGCRRQEILTVKKSNNIKAPVGDASRPAVKYDFKTAAGLTPTLRNFTLEGKTAVVTGGARGLGLNMAQGLLESGISGLVVMDQNQALGEESVAQLSTQTGVDIRFYKTDVRDEAATKEAIDNAVSHFGTPHILIHSAGVAESNIKAENYDIEKFKRQIDINLGGTFVMAKTVANAMINAKAGGSIIFIASMSGSIVNYPQNQCGYNASKAGVIQLTRNLSAEWARFNIRVNSISPGYMDTALNRVMDLDSQKAVWIDHTPQKRLGKIDDLNGAAVFLASEASSFMTGTNITIDGGYTVW